MWASGSAALATLARLNGLALLFPILIEYLYMEKDSIAAQWNLKTIWARFKESLGFKKILKSRIVAVILIPLSFMGYLAYVQLKFASWNAVFTSMKVWNQDKLTDPLRVMYRYIKIFIANSPHQLTYWTAVTEFVFVLFYISLLVYSFKKIRMSYWVFFAVSILIPSLTGTLLSDLSTIIREGCLFFAVSILIPSLTGTFQGMPRYGLHLYPMFLSIAILLEKRNMFWKGVYFIVSSVVLFLLLALFTRGYFVA